MDGLFEFFFKYRPLIFEQGDFALRASWLGFVAVAVAQMAQATLLIPGKLSLRRCGRQPA